MENKTVDYTQKVLEVKNLRQYFRTGWGKNKFVTKAIDDISFDIYKREVFGLVGESGCGKTTTGRTIIKLYSPTDGTIEFNGVRIGAGYSGNLYRIKKAKEKADYEIIKANTFKHEKYLIVQESSKKLDILAEQISQLKEQHRQELVKLNRPFNDYKNAVQDEKKRCDLKVSDAVYAQRLELARMKRENATSEAIKAKRVEHKEKIAKTEVEAKEFYHNQVESLASSVPTKESFVKAKQELKENLTKEIALIAEQQRALKKETNARVALVVADKKANPGNYTIDKDAIAKTKKEYLETLDFERKGIKQAKYDNKVSEPKELKEKRLAALKEAKQSLKVEFAQLKEQLAATEKGSPEYQKISEQIKERKKAGKSEIAAINATLVNQTDIMTKIQMIFQDPIASLNPRMVVREIIAEGLRIQGIHDRKVIDEKVFNSLKLVGLLPDHANRYPHEFSGGQRQRIGIARALVINPEFIIADEPISALDVSIQAQVINLLTDLKNELGLTILFIAHDLSVVKYFSDRIGVMYFGKMVELASADELFKNPLHPYTKSLLSAIPHPDPISEKKRQRVIYNPTIHDYSTSKPSVREIKPGHFIYANDEEFKDYQKELGIK